MNFLPLRRVALSVGFDELLLLLLLLGEASMLPIIVTTGDTTTDDRNYRYLKEQNTFIFLMKKTNQNLVELIRLLYESMLSAARINTWPTE